MGFPPPPDAPPVAQQTASALQAGFSAGPPVVELCGFKLPIFLFSFGLHLPALAFPPALPIPRLSIGLNCSLTNPVAIDASLDYGGGRVPTSDPDPDLALDQASGP